MTRFFLVRHGETEWNRLRKIQGISDIPLNDTGRSQAAALGDILSKHRFDLIVSSPLSRALETAQIVARKLGMPAPLVIQDLVERNYGEAEGSSGLELDTLYPPGTEIPGREDRADVTKRVVRTLHDLAIRHPEADILAVAHGAVIRCVVSNKNQRLHDGPDWGSDRIRSFLGCVCAVGVLDNGQIKMSGLRAKSLHAFSHGRALWLLPGFDR